MDLLDKIYFDNTLRSYLIAGGTIVTAMLLKRYLSRYVASLFYSVARRIWKGLHKKQFFALVVLPLEYFFLILITIFTLDKLTFPHVLLHNVYGHPTNEIFSRSGTALIIISFTWLMMRLMDFIAVVLKEQARPETDIKENQLIIFFRDFLKVIIGLCGVLLIIKACFNQHIGNLLTGLSLVGAALALAAKESLENLIASFIIFFDKPFFTNDTVNVNNITGTVERIGLRSTRIRTLDKTLVTVPNKQMVDSVVDNWSMRVMRRAVITLELSEKNTSDVLQKLIAQLKNTLEKESNHVLSSSVFFKEVNKDGSVVTIEYFTQPFSLEEFNTLKQEVNFSIKKIIEENEIEMAGGADTIVVNNK